MEGLPFSKLAPCGFPRQVAMSIFHTAVTRTLTLTLILAGQPCLRLRLISTHSRQPGHLINSLWPPWSSMNSCWPAWSRNQLLQASLIPLSTSSDHPCLRITRRSAYSPYQLPMTTFASVLALTGQPGLNFNSLCLVWSLYQHSLVLLISISTLSSQSGTRINSFWLP